MLSREGSYGSLTSEACPALLLRCWGDRALGFFHYTHVMHFVWFTQHALAALGDFCGSNSLGCPNQGTTLPGLHSKYSKHEEETSISYLFSPVKDDIVPTLVPFHSVIWSWQLGAAQYASSNTNNKNKHDLHDMHGCPESQHSNSLREGCWWPL